MPKFSLKAKVEKLDDVAEAYRPAYVEKEGAFVLDPEKLEAVEFDDKAEVFTALENERKEAKTLREKLELLKDVDPEEYKKLKQSEQERDRDNKKKSNDWEGWKKTFEESKEKELAAKDAEIIRLQTRNRKLILDDRVRAAGLEAGVRKQSIDRVVRDLLHPDRPRFRVTDSEAIEVLDDSGSPMDVKLDSFFKDKYITEAPEFYEPNGAQGSGALAAKAAGGNGVIRLKREDAKVNPRLYQDAKARAEKTPGTTIEWVD